MFQEKPQAFLALPFAEPFFRELASQIGEVLEGQGIQSVRADPAAPVMEEIQAAIRGADIVVADITGKNANVWLEVGMAIGQRKPVLLLSQDRPDRAMSNLLGHDVVVYRPNDLATVRRYLELWLRDVRRNRESAAS